MTTPVPTIPAVDPLDLTQERVEVGDTVAFVEKINRMQSELETMAAQINAMGQAVVPHIEAVKSNIEEHNQNTLTQVTQAANKFKKATKSDVINGDDDKYLTAARASDILEAVVSGSWFEIVKGGHNVFRGNLDELIETGFYKNDDDESKGHYSQVVVSRNGDTISQIVVDYRDASMYVRAANRVGFVPNNQIPWTAWRKVSFFSGSYNDLSNKPNLFSGAYNDLSDKPIIGSLQSNVYRVGEVGKVFARGNFDSSPLAKGVVAKRCYLDESANSSEFCGDFLIFEVISTNSNVRGWIYGRRII